MNDLLPVSMSNETEHIIRKLSEHGYPEEICGFLFGRDETDRREIVHIEAELNERDSNRGRRFLISAEEFRKAEQRAENLGLDLLGIYHSHPDHPAIPSDFDRENALPFYSYIIVSVREGGSAEIRSWQLDLDGNSYTEEKVILNSSLTVS